MADSFVRLMLLSSAAPSIAAPFPRFLPLQRRVQERHSSWPILPNPETGHFTAIVDVKSHQIGSNAI
jgi:hypothetical protein